MFGITNCTNSCCKLAVAVLPTPLELMSDIDNSNQIIANRSLLENWQRWDDWKNEEDEEEEENEENEKKDKWEMPRRRICSWKVDSSHLSLSTWSSFSLLSTGPFFRAVYSFFSFKFKLLRRSSWWKRLERATSWHSKPLSPARTPKRITKTNINRNWKFSSERITDAFWMAPMLF